MWTRLIRILRPLNRQYLFQCSPVRQFSTAIALQKSYARPLPVLPSPQAIASNNPSIPDDLGLASGTFVRVPWNKLPPVKGIGEWARYEWNCFKERIRDYYSLYQYRSLTGRKPYFNVNVLPGSKDEIVTLAKTRYNHIYSAFARKDEQKINEICVSGVAKEFCQRLKRCPTDLKMEWKIVNYSKWPNVRMVSNRALEISFPGQPQTWIRQVIVRIKTRQRLQVKRTTATMGAKEQPRKAKRSLAWTPDGVATQEADSAVGKDTGTPKSSDREEDVTEYLVLQKRVLHGTEDKDWKIWGFASETTLKSIALDKERERNMVAAQS